MCPLPFSLYCLCKSTLWNDFQPLTTWRRWNRFPGGLLDVYPMEQWLFTFLNKLYELQISHSCSTCFALHSVRVWCQFNFGSHCCARSSIIQPPIIAWYQSSRYWILETPCSFWTYNIWMFCLLILGYLICIETCSNLVVSSISLRTKLAELEVALLRFYVTSFRGDWKAMKAMFSFRRHYNTNEATVLLSYLKQRCFQKTQMVIMFFWVLVCSLE